MEFRKATNEDTISIMDIIRQAQTCLKQCGIDQWQNNYPNMEIIVNDIKNRNSYIAIKNNKIAGTVCVDFGGEKTYKTIYDGQWLTGGQYAVIHRIAVDSVHKRNGLASEIIISIEAICLKRDIHSIRVDTHRDNLAMQKLLQKNGFIYCGIIYLEDGNERIAFEKVF